MIGSVRRAHERRKSWYRGWRTLVAAARIARPDHPDHDARRVMAMLADATFLLRLDRCNLLAVRMLARDDALWPDAGHDVTLVKRVIFANVRAGYWIESARLAEHIGALEAFGPGARTGYDQGLQAALQGEDAIALSILGMRWTVPVTALNDIHGMMTRKLKWLPDRIVEELYALVLIGLESLLFADAAGSVRRKGDAAGLTGNIVANLYRRRASARRRVTDDGPRLIFGLESGYLVYRASAGGHERGGMLESVAGWTPNSDPVPVRDGDLLFALLDFHLESRQAMAEDLLAPTTLLRIGGRIVETALDRLPNRPRSGELVIEARGLPAALPWPALWTGWSHLVEDFDICVDDGLPIAASDRAPRLAALFGTTAAMAGEAAVVVADARAAGWPADDPCALTRATLAAALARATIVHVAAHMSAHPHDPARARLQLADGTWVEVAELTPHATGVELLFMAGCESGILADSEDSPGRDGTRPWRQAGVASIVSTLWRISDHHSTMLVRGFYARLLAGEPRAAALAGSQRDMLRATGEFALPAAERFIEPDDATPPSRPADDPAHPRIWGAFRLTGAGGPVRVGDQAAAGSIPSMNP